jgi:hypothetical protein
VEYIAEYKKRRRMDHTDDKFSHQL